MGTERTYYSREAEMRVAREQLALTLMCVLLGLGIGSMLALMFAPTTGERMRRELGHILENSVNSGREKVEPTIAQLEHEFNDLRHKVEARLG